MLETLALVSWRDVRSLGSITGQNIFLFIALVAMQPESAAFFLLLLSVVLFFPLSTDPMEKIPAERRTEWPLQSWEWNTVRLVSVLLSPVTWLGIVLLFKAGWLAGLLVIAVGLVVSLIRRWPVPPLPYRLPAPPGVIGQITRLQWRSMWRTLDPYFALVLSICTLLYRIFGKSLDPAALRIMSLVVVLAVSTHAQVLFGIDGKGAERYRLLPIRGWQILLAKDLAFLLLVTLLIAPLDWLSGFFGAIATLAVGHHQSVWKPVSQERWRFTSGALFPHGFLQTVALFAVGNVVSTQGFLFVPVCLAAWLTSVFVYGWVWDRKR